MTSPKKLIEVALPVREISAECVRDKFIRHGHISTLHLWWARRPLPVCRAVVFASLVPDPLDPCCPQAFREAVQILIGQPFALKTGEAPLDWCKPYEDIPWTPVYDPMPDNLRNRLQMFIGKFSESMQNYLSGKPTQRTKPSPGEQLSAASLIKWENKNNPVIIGMARKLIFVAHQAAQPRHARSTAQTLLALYDQLFDNIRRAEEQLYNLPDRHLKSSEAQRLQEALRAAVETFLDHMPRVFDPFAGGGAIPLEAARLGCRSYGNDINPVAHIIQKGSLEFPQKYGKPVIYSPQEFARLYGADTPPPPDAQITPQGIRIPNRLAFDVEYYARKMIAMAEADIGHYYPADANGKKPIAYYWVRTATCANPACRAEVPLLKQFYLADTDNKQVYLNPRINGNRISFDIRYGTCPIKEGWNLRGNLKCPCCGSVTDVKLIKQQNIEGKVKERLLAVIVDGENGKEYRLPYENEIQILADVPITERPKEKMMRNSAGGDTHSWGVTEWGQMFSSRQLPALHTFAEKINALKAEIGANFDEDYAKAVITYLAIFLDRIVARSNSFCLWSISKESLEHPFSRQAIPMVFDYPESNPFCDSTGSALNQLEWITRYITSECDHPFTVSLQHASGGDKSQFPEKYLTAVVTDPPYYDAIAYADLSDFFYVWLKRTLGDLYPLNFATPQTPKADECTALKHHHNNDKDAAKRHFEQKLTQIFDAIEHQTSEIVAVMFAHKTTEAWTTLCKSLLAARMNITGSWAIDTEMSNRMTALAGAALKSSVTVSARTSQRLSVGSYRQVCRAIERRVAAEVELLYGLGFRGADLLTACFGQAISEFGKYDTVEKADGTQADIPEMLELASESAFNALIKGFRGDEFTKFYIGWLQLYGFAESDFDDAAKFAKAGLSINVQELFREHILLKNGNRQSLAAFAERISLSPHLGERSDSALIDRAHRAMYLYKNPDRGALLRYLQRTAPVAESPLWRVLTALSELLPKGCDDYEQAKGLLANKDSLLREAAALQHKQAVQGEKS